MSNNWYKYKNLNPVTKAILRNKENSSNENYQNTNVQINIKYLYF